jgi:hypothetical protein
MKLKETPIYETVLRILKEIPPTRESDKKLIWRVWTELGLVTHDYHSQCNYITEDGFLEASNTGSITRARRKAQELNSDLQPTDPKVRKARGLKEATKGTFIYFEGARTGSLFNG